MNGERSSQCSVDGSWSSNPRASFAFDRKGVGDFATTLLSTEF